MQKIAAITAAAMLSIGYIASNVRTEDKSIYYKIPEINECNDASHAPFEIFINPGEEKFLLRRYQTKCDDFYDIRTLSKLDNDNPIIYMIDSDRDDISDEFYYDEKLDGINENEYRCNGLDECIWLALRKGKQKEKEMPLPHESVGKPEILRV